MKGFTRVTGSPSDDWPWPVFTRGAGPPVVILQELAGVTPELLYFATRLSDEGFTVWLPVLAGPAPATTALDRTRAMVATCLSHEIHLFATRRTSPMANSLRALTRHAAQHCGTAGAGVIGMCWTGGFALALAADKSVLGAVAAQPSLPLGTPLTPRCRRSLGMDESDIRTVQDRLATGEVEIYLTRFTDDWISPRERIAALEKAWGSTGITIDQLSSAPDNPFGFGKKDHSVLSIAPVRHPDGPGRDRLDRTYQEVVSFLRRRIIPAALP